MRLLTHYQNALKAGQPEIINWRENSINDSLFYSYRSTQYSRGTYPSCLHYHDYYELVIFVEGDIHYICKGDSYRPRCGDVILIPPRKLHMSAIDAETTRYVRHVFYLYPNAFDELDCAALAGFLKRDSKNCCCMSPDADSRQTLFSLLSKLDGALRHPGDPLEHSLALSAILEIFYILNTGCHQFHAADVCLPRNVLDIQRYIDANFARISSVAELASHFYYSREYVSRLFKQYFNTTVSDYLTKRRIAYSQRLIEQGMPLSEVCFHAGFSSLSAFIRAFHSVAGMTPSAYRKALSAPK